MIDRQPALIARCASTVDVAAAVRHAARHGLTAVARCGGHSVSGASLPHDGLLVDLSGLKRITVDPKTRMASVGGGALLGELDAALQAHGLAVTAGVEPETGVGGLTLGGGIGFLARKLGLTIDSLVGAEVVLADGSVVEANAESHPDLFWALRGGGGQFGIVTRFDFRASRVGPEVVVAQAFYPLAKAHDVMRFVREFMHDAADDLTLVPVFMTVPPVDPCPAEWQGRHTVAMVACHAGEHEAARQQVQPMLELGDMIFGFVATQRYVDFQKTFGGASPHGERFYWKSIFVDNLSEDLTDVLVDGIRSLQGEYSQIFMETLGGAVARVGVEDTAFANRKARYNLGISAGWADPACDAEIMGAARATYEKLKRFSDGTVYLNYLDRDEIARAREGFGPNFARLQEVKNRYDPGNVFGGVLGGAG
ncbi:FAD-binding oxidoreductase [Aurantiacibacter zhengii]|uniref:FAD-binding oxidoreductase n=1 Tax=Aurantiacibacter zhengii TaxID=2307003 RepID=A0A418NSY6_9SPHN|nr:FAD-binding oxidoreductase [Aurantiacibacter zhengii]RIV86755.1 FAD-binding oxidoreductase [Aurantiacibacter zhengii]